MLGHGRPLIAMHVIDGVKFYLQICAKPTGPEIH
jgi:hypothetical protein